MLVFPANALTGVFGLVTVPSLAPGGLGVVADEFALVAARLDPRSTWPSPAARVLIGDGRECSGQSRSSRATAASRSAVACRVSRSVTPSNAVSSLVEVRSRAPG